MSQYWAGGEVWHCHRVNSLPSASGGQEMHRAAGHQWGAVSLCPQGPDMRQWALLSLYCLSLPSHGFFPGLLRISMPPPLSSGCDSRLSRLTSHHLRANAFAVTGVLGAFHQTQCIANLEQGSSLNHSSTDCPPKLSQIPPATVCRGGGTAQHAAAQNTCPK